jgi:hypothetical protein
VGTTVVTKHNERLALGRLGVLCEQSRYNSNLNFQIVLTSTAMYGKMLSLLYVSKHR